MNAGDLYPLFAAMLTQRPWEQARRRALLRVLLRALRGVGVAGRHPRPGLRLWLGPCSGGPGGYPALLP